MVHYHDVLVSTAVMDGEATCVLSIHFTDGHDLEILLDRNWGIGPSGELGGGVFGLVDLMPWRFWTRCPMVVASAEGQYLVALARVSPGHDE